MSVLSIAEVGMAATLITSTLWILVSMLERAENNGFVNAIAQGADQKTQQTDVAQVQHFGTPETMTNDLMALSKILARSGRTEEIGSSAETPEMVAMPRSPRVA